MPQLERKDIEKALQQKGFILDDDGNHKKFFFNFPKLNKQIFTMTSHGSSYKTIHDSLIGKMARQLFLTKEEFISFIKCDIELTEYYNILIEKKLVG